MTEKPVSVEKEFPVQPILRKLFCTKCDIEMQRTAEVKPVHPPIYVYKCTSCGEIANSTISYPSISFEELPE